MRVEEESLLLSVSYRSGDRVNSQRCGPRNGEVLPSGRRTFLRKEGSAQRVVLELSVCIEFDATQRKETKCMQYNRLWEKIRLEN